MLVCASHLDLNAISHKLLTPQLDISLPFMHIDICIYIYLHQDNSLSIVFQ